MVGVKGKGRPRRQGSLHKFVRINDRLKEILDSERKPGERYSDTVQRMLYERAQKIQALTQEINRLK